MEPLLFLEGDASCQVQEGQLVFDTFYSLLGSEDHNAPKVNEYISLSSSNEDIITIIQERSSVQSHEKTYTHIQRKVPHQRNQRSMTENKNRECIFEFSHFDLDSRLNTIQINQINNGLLHFGTGSITWEASIVMSLFFTKNPSLLSGNILELGCGCGLGFLTWSMVSPHGYISSYTFTDSCPEVLSQCEHNIRLNLKTKNQCHESFPVHFHRLNWYDYDHDEMTKSRPNMHCMYDTLIASDVAYRAQDIQPLKNTIMHFLKEGSCAHVFGPIDRVTLQDFVKELKQDDRLCVCTDVLPISRWRLPAASDKDVGRDFYEGSMESCSSCVCFLHVSISHRIRSCTSIHDINDLD